MSRRTIVTLSEFDLKLASVMKTTVSQNPCNPLLRAKCAATVNLHIARRRFTVSETLSFIAACGLNVTTSSISELLNDRRFALTA